MFSLRRRPGEPPQPPGAIAPGSDVPLRYDVRIVAPSTLRIENDQAQIVASTELNLRGTFDRPLLFGRADIERGDVRFEGRRYQVTRGSLDFTNPNRIQPFFDIEAETRVRVPGQTYRVTLRMAGTTERMQPAFESDPPLAPLDILNAALQRYRADRRSSSWRRCGSPTNASRRSCRRARRGRSPASFPKKSAASCEQTFGVDTFQITPLLIDPYQQSSRLNVNPSARVTIGKRISDRVYLTYARSLSSSRATKSSCSNTIRTIVSAGSCRRTKTAPTRSKCARGICFDVPPPSPRPGADAVAGGDVHDAPGVNCGSGPRRHSRFAGPSDSPPFMSRSAVHPTPTRLSCSCSKRVSANRSRWSGCARRSIISSGWRDSRTSACLPMPRVRARRASRAVGAGAGAADCRPCDRWPARRFQRARCVRQSPSDSARRR